MRSGLYSLAEKIGKVIAGLTVIVTSVSVSTACMWLTYQPEEPDEIRNMRKS